MADFETFAAVETFVYAGVAAGTYINGFASRQPDGTLAARVQQPMSATNPDYGAWTDVTDDGE